MYKRQVWNGLTDEWHPTQMLADQLTMTERSTKPLREVSVAYVGDARFNEGNSHLVSGALSGMDMRIIAPKELQNSAEVIATANEIAATTGARLTVTDDPNAVEGVDFVSTDVWVSMGEPKEAWAERIDPVSYTHLDVYKRQSSSGCMSATRCGGWRWASGPSAASRSAGWPPH